MSFSAAHERNGPSAVRTERCEVLSNGDLVIWLRGDCVQTAAKRTREQLVAACLESEGPGDHGFGAPLELLRRFLEQTDFTQLRSRHPEVAGGTSCGVRLHQGSAGAVLWERCHP